MLYMYWQIFSLIIMASLICAWVFVIDLRTCASFWHLLPPTFFFLSKRPAQIPILPISPVFLFIYHHFAAGLVDCSRRKTTKSSSFLVSYYIVLNGDFFYSNIILQCFHITSWQQPYIDACTLALLFLACFVSSLLPCWFQVPFTFSLPIPTILSTPYLFFFLFLSTLTYTTWIPMCDPLIPHLTFVLFLLFFCRARSIS